MWHKVCSQLNFCTVVVLLLVLLLVHLISISVTLEDFKGAGPLTLKLVAYSCEEAHFSGTRET